MDQFKKLSIFKNQRHNVPIVMKLYQKCLLNHKEGQLAHNYKIAFVTRCLVIDSRDFYKNALRLNVFTE